MFKICTDGWHMSAVARGSLSQRRQWLSSLRQIKSTEVHFKTPVAACDKTAALPPNVIIQWIEVRWIGGHSSLAMKSMKLEAWNGKNDKYS